MPEADPLRSDDPRRIGGYTISGLLGEGGQGVVYLGESASGLPVAVKLLHARLAGDGAARERFLREIDTVRRVAQFCTARVLDVGVEGDRPYVVSELVQGPSLHRRVTADGPLTGGELDRLAVGMATALAAIHEASVLHRDFKPHNVLLGPDGPRVIDFGIARALDVTSTLTSGPVGTPAYMAPEQITGGPLTTAVDIFCWAGTIVFAATGRPPFGQDSIPAVMHRILNIDPDLTDVPERLGALVGACLAKDPARRPSASEILLRLLGHPETASGTRAESATSALAEGTAVARGAPLSTRVEDAAASRSTAVVRPVAARREPRQLIVLVGAVVAVVLVAGLVIFAQSLSGGLKGGTGSTGGGAPPSQTVSIGFMGALSGLNAQLGANPLNGAQLAVDQYNATNPAVKLALTRYDTQGDATIAVSKAQKAVSDHAVAVIGPLFSGEAKAAVPVLEQAAIPSVTPAASNPALAQQGWRYWHRIIASDAAAAPAAANLLKSLGAKKVFVIDDGSPYGAGFGDQGTTALQSGGISTSRDRIDPNGNDFSATVVKVKADGPDAVIYGGYYNAAGKLLKQLRDGGVTARFVTDDGALDPGLITGAGTSQAEGSLVTCVCRSIGPRVTDQALTAFSNAYKAKFGTDQGIYSVEGYDAANLLIAAIKSGSTTPAKINQFLGGASLPGLSKTIKFASDGDLADNRIFIYEVRGGVFTYLGDSTTARP